MTALAVSLRCRCHTTVALRPPSSTATDASSRKVRCPTCGRMLALWVESTGVLRR